MGFFDTLIQSAGPPLAAGFAGGIEDDRVRRANLADNVQAYRSLMPYKMGTYEQQKQIDQRYNKPQITFAPKGSPGYFDSTGFHPTPQAAEQTNPLMGILTGKTEVPQEPAIMPSKPGTFDYGAGEEAMAGAAPTTRSVSGEQALLRMFGMNPQEREVVPHLSAKGEVSASFQKRPSSATSSPITDASQLPAPSPGMQWVQGVDAKGNPTWHQVMAGAQSGRGEFTRERVAVEEQADKLGITDPEERSGFITGRMARYRGAQATATGAGGTLGRNTGAALQSQGDAAYLRGLQAGLGHTKAELTSVSPSGQPTTEGLPAITQRETQKIKGEAIPAAERGRFAELYNLQDMISRVRELTKDFQSGWFGPVRGGIVAPFSERITGNISDQEVQARRLMLDSADMLLRARSGAQINEQEYKRLARLLPTPDLPENVAKARMDDFEKTLGNVISERERMQSMPAGQLGAPKATSKHRLSGTKTNKPDGQYPLKDGTTITVKGGVVQ